MRQQLLTFMALMTLMISGCSDDRHDHLADRLCREGKEDAAAVEYERAILAGESPHESHVWLAEYYDGNGRDTLKAVLHARKALENATTQEAVGIKELLARNEKRLYDELLQRDVQRGDDDMRVKVKLLEEHARNQSRWLEELRRENSQLRRELGEHQ